MVAAGIRETAEETDNAVAVVEEPAGIDAHGGEVAAL
jgi:hypothetical protein